MIPLTRYFPLAILLCIAAAVDTSDLPAQTDSHPTLCPTVMGVYPVDFKHDEPLSRRPRFEIRSCRSDFDIQLVGFRAGATTPTLIEPGDHIELLIQTGTLILVQMTAGSSSPTLVAQFRKGIPVLLGREDGVGGVTYSEDHTDGDYAIITIPQKTSPNASGKFPKVAPHRYRLKIYE